MAIELKVPVFFNICMDIKNSIITLLKKFKIVIIIIFIGLLILKAVELTHMRITAVFDELEPFSNLAVYYKGFKIGKATKVVPNKDFTKAHVHIILNSWSYNLPNNISAKVQKKKDSADYMEILYPNSPALARIKYGDTIQGTVSHDLTDLINNVAEGNGLDELKGNANNLLSGATEATQNISELLKEITSILKDIHPQITNASFNLRDTSEHLSKMSAKLEKAVDEQMIYGTFANVQKTTGNFKNTSDTINQKTLPLINATICSIKTLTDNLNKIVTGLEQTLKQRMGGAKIIFGTAIK